MATIDIPQGGSMAKYLECNDVKAAYQVACLGVTEADWKALAQAALQVGLGLPSQQPPCSNHVHGTTGVCLQPLQVVGALQQCAHTAAGAGTH